MPADGSVRASPLLLRRADAAAVARRRRPQPDSGARHLLPDVRRRGADRRPYRLRLRHLRLHRLDGAGLGAVRLSRHRLCPAPGQPYRHGPDDGLAAVHPLEDRAVRCRRGDRHHHRPGLRQLHQFPAGLFHRRFDDGHPAPDLARQADGAPGAQRPVAAPVAADLRLPAHDRPSRRRARRGAQAHHPRDAGARTRSPRPWVARKLRQEPR